MTAPAVISERIGDMLVREGMITREQLNHALQEQTENGTRVGYNLVKLGFVVDETNRYAIIAARPGGGNIALTHVVNDVGDGAEERIAETATARALHSDNIASLEPVVAKAGREMLCNFCVWIDDACTLAAGETVASAERLDAVFIGAHGKTDVVGQDAVVTGEAQAAAPFSGAANAKPNGTAA